ncbi:integrase [Pasteurellaceae bacterium Macca]|nr:integrase [Pasteurellaceae bacterium Macca]
MARTTKPLTHTEIERAKPKAKEYSLADGGGLLLRIKPSGAKLWLFNYCKPFTNKRSNLSLGSYPSVTLAQAREKAGECRALLEQQRDPAIERLKAQDEQAERLARTFGKMAVAWFDSRRLQANFTERTAKDAWALFERHLLPLFGQYPIDQLTPLIAINGLKPLEQAGKLETVRKLISKLNDVMRFALHRGFIASNPLREIHKEFDKPITQGMKTITPDELADFLNAFCQAQQAGKFSPTAYYGVLLALLTGSRPSEIAKAKWADIDEQGKCWRYTVQKGNKNLPQGRIHTVTLSRQAIALFHAMKRHNALMRCANSPYVFASLTAKAGHISIETLRKAIIKSIGENKLTTHGIRHLFSTALNDRNFNADWIERALSHKDRNAIRETYNNAEYLDQRAEMLQQWADYLESLIPYSLIVNAC